MPYQRPLRFQGVEIHPEDRTDILPHFLIIETDQKASLLNAILPMFVPPFPHPVTGWVDAWTQEGNRWNDVYLCGPN